MIEPNTAPAGTPDYLWDRSGVPDPDVERLERLLAPLAYRGAPRRVPRINPRVAVAAAAAAVVLLSVGAWFTLRPAGPAWTVDRVAGSPRLDRRPVTETARFRRGQWLTTDGASLARVEIEDIGFLDVRGDTRVRLVSSGPAGRNPDGSTRVEHRLTMDRGTIEAFTIVPPEVFFIDTPSATAVDYGCQYTLTTDEHGEGLLAVTLGLVKLRWQGREVSVPQGMSCRILPRVGPGEPFTTP